MSPSSHAFSTISWGQVPSRSYSHATGRISFAANSCAISCSAFCSSVSVKSTTVCVLLRAQIDWSVNLTPVGRPGAPNLGGWRGTYDDPGVQQALGLVIFAVVGVAVVAAFASLFAR